MTHTGGLLPASTHHITAGGKDIYLVGTAHVSRQSVDDVRSTVESLRPDTICIELCAARHKALVRRDDWKKMNIFKVIREKKALFLLAQLILNSFYRRIGEQLGVQPGAEMLEGIRLADENGCGLVLADRDIEITLKRVWGYLGFWSRLKMIFQLAAGIFVVEDIDADLVETMKSQDQLESILQTFSRKFPEIKKRLIDERDIYLAQKISRAPGKTVVAVVGAGHVAGIRKHVHSDIPLEPLMKIPPGSFVPAVIKWTIPLVVAMLLVAGFLKGGTQHAVESVYIWILVNGVLAGFGAALALAHPLTILASFVGAPLTSLNPMIAAGWVAGLVQAWVRKPTVADLEDLPEALTTVKGFWLNPASKILLVVVLANLGSSLGTFISGGWIAARMF